MAEWKFQKFGVQTEKGLSEREGWVYGRFGYWRDSLMPDTPLTIVQIPEGLFLCGNNNEMTAVRFVRTVSTSLRMIPPKHSSDQSQRLRNKYMLGGESLARERDRDLG